MGGAVTAACRVMMRFIGTEGAPVIVFAISMTDLYVPHSKTHSKNMLV